MVLPTAPSSVRCGLNVDLDRIPMHGPFKLFIANVSYDANEEMVASMFQGLDVRGPGAAPSPICLLCFHTSEPGVFEAMN